MDLTQKFGISGIEVRSRGLRLLSPCVEKLCAFCCSHDLVLKRQAVSALGSIGDMSALDFIESLLVEDTDTAGEAAMAMASIDEPSVLSRLLKAFQSSPPATKAVIIPAFGHYSGEMILFALSRVLTDRESPDLIKRAVAKVIAQIGDVAFSGALLDALPSSAEKVQVEILKALIVTGFESDEEGFEILRHVFTHEAADRPKVRSAILSALRSMKGTNHFDFAISALTDANPRVVANAVELLGSIEEKPRKIANHLKPLLEDVSDSRVRANIAVVLFQSEPALAASVLSGLLNSSEKKDRSSAAYAARFVKDDRMAMWLTTLLASEEDGDVIGNIFGSLEHFEEEQVFDPFVKFLQSPNPVTRSGTARALGRIGNNDCKDSIVSVLEKEEDPLVLSEMIIALGKLSDPSLVPVISEYLQHTDLRVQANSVEALNEIGTVEIVPFIEPFINSSDNRVKANAAVALWSMGSLEVVSSLCDMLDHLNLKQRSSAAYAIGEIGRTLTRLTDEPNKYHFLISALKNDIPVPADVSKHTGEFSGEHGLPLEPVHALDTDFVFPLKEAEKYFGLLRQRQPDKARMYLDSLLAKDPDSIFIKYLKADFLRKSQNIIKASEAFREFSQISAEAGEPFVNGSIHLANICNSAHDQEQSIGAYFDALSIQLKIVESELALGRSLLESGEVNEASLLLKNLVSRISLNSKLHYMAGRNFLKGKDNEKAFRNLFKAYLVAPDNGEILLGLAFASYKTQRYEFVRILGKKMNLLFGESSPLFHKVLELVKTLDNAGF